MEGNRGRRREKRWGGEGEEKSLRGGRKRADKGLDNNGRGTRGWGVGERKKGVGRGEAGAGGRGGKWSWGGVWGKK